MPWSASEFLPTIRRTPYGSVPDFPLGRLVEGDEPGYDTFLVTNKHVASASPTLRVLINITGATPVILKLSSTDESGEDMWQHHPDGVTDIAVTRVNAGDALKMGASINIFRSSEDTLLVDGLKTEEVSEGDRAYVMGFPLGNVGRELAVRS